MRSRRTTLGPVNPNRKSSFGAGRTGTGTPSADAKKQMKKRASMLPRMAGGREPLYPPSPAPSGAGGSRRQSVGGDSRRRSGGADRRQSLVPPPAPPAKTDPRPISDKSYQSSCSKRLLRFLLDSGYDNPITIKSLARPSGKDFQNIVTFMLRRIDPTFQHGTMKLEDEVAMQFKALGYPFTVSKTALVAAGSPHTWPALLAALTWLMELLQSTEADSTGEEQQPKLDFTENLDGALDELENQTDKAFFKYMSSAYVAFLKGDTEMTQSLEEELVDMFERDNMVLEREIERGTDLNAAIVENINQLGQQSQDLPTLEKKREDYATDLDQFQDLVRQMDKHKETFDKKVKERTAELASTNQELEAVTARVNALKETIQTQDVSVDDLRKMKSEQNRLEESMERASVLKQQHSKALWDSEMHLTKAIEELETTIAEYNAKKNELCLSSSLDLKVSLNVKNAHEKDQSKLLGVDMNTVVVPALSQCKLDYIERIAEARREHQELLDQLESTGAALTEAFDGLKIVEAKNAKQEELLSREREEKEGALEVRMREVEATEAKIDSLRDPVALEEAIARYQRQCIELEALQVKNQEENIAKKKAYQDEINKVMRQVAEHKKYQQQKLAELQQYILQKKASVGTIVVPAEVTLED